MSSANGTVYIPSRYKPWSSVGFEAIPELNEIMTFHSDLGIGFMPVFDSLEAFEAAYPGEEPIVARFVGKGEYGE